VNFGEKSSTVYSKDLLPAEQEADGPDASGRPGHDILSHLRHGTMRLEFLLAIIGCPQNLSSLSNTEDNRET
jgi:hypothetical protein